MRLTGSTIAVTGGTGFLGRHLAAELEGHGAKVLALGRAGHDLRRRAEIDRMLADTRPDAVVHLAAVVGGIGANREQPGRFFYENALMGIELLEACRVAGVPKVVLWGDGSPTREFLHMRDAARAFRLALERYDGPKPVNLGSGEEIAIGALAALVAGATGYRGEVVWDTSKPNGQPRRRLATDQARALLGFEAAVALREGIAELVAWYDRSP